MEREGAGQGLGRREGRSGAIAEGKKKKWKCGRGWWMREWNRRKEKESGAGNAAWARVMVSALLGIGESIDGNAGERG
jgi:hypothetical protein